jgi:hypothetical protein
MERGEGVKRELRAISGDPTRWDYLFRYDTHLTIDTILAIAHILKAYETAASVKIATST